MIHIIQSLSDFIERAPEPSKAVAMSWPKDVDVLYAVRG